MNYKLLCVEKSCGHNINLCAVLATALPTIFQRYNSFVYLFVFVLNWEAWFFGIKMDGFYAGIILFTYCLVASVLAHLLIRYPRRIAVIAAISVLYFGFLFTDSAVTIQILSEEQGLFSSFMAVQVLIPVGILTGHLLVGRFCKRRTIRQGARAVSMKQIQI